VRRQIAVRYVGEVLLQLTRNLPLGDCIECLAKITQRVRRRNENQTVELVALARLVQQRGNLVHEAPLVGLVQILARLHRVMRRRRALVHSARPLCAEFVRVVMEIHRDELLASVERSLPVTPPAALLQDACAPAIGDDVPYRWKLHSRSSGSSVALLTDILWIPGASGVIFRQDRPFTRLEQRPNRGACVAGDLKHAAFPARK